jgi:hypothetical protein
MSKVPVCISAAAFVVKGRKLMDIAVIGSGISGLAAALGGTLEWSGSNRATVGPRI